MLNKTLVSCLGAIACCLAVGIQSTQAAVYSLNATDTGWYNSSGDHGSTNKNYIAGNPGPITHNFFVFDLSTVSGTITSAVLKAYNPAFGVLNAGGDGTSGLLRTYNLFDVSTPIATLALDHLGTGGAIFTDLGTGTNLGSNAGPFPNDSTISTYLNGSGLTYLQGAVGGSVAIGGEYTGAAFDDFIFGFTNELSNQIVQLEITTRTPDSTVPEPSSLLIFGGLAGMLVTRLRRKK